MERKTKPLKRKTPQKRLQSVSEGLHLFVSIGFVPVSKPPTAYTVTIIIYLQNIPHKVIEYLNLACFVYLVFLIDINFVDEIS